MTLKIVHDTKHDTKTAYDAKNAIYVLCSRMKRERIEGIYPRIRWESSVNSVIASLSSNAMELDRSVL